MKTTGHTDNKLQERLLLARRVENDRLVLADATMAAALDGSRALTAGERTALRASPLTLRRFRTLALEHRRTMLPAGERWCGSHGMLRAAADARPLAALVTDDGLWALHFVEQGGAWRVILALDANAPFAQRLVREQPMLRVVDGAGALVLQGALDGDGECEGPWPFDAAPAPHFHAVGGAFAVEPLAP